MSTDEALRFQRLGDSERIEHVERRRMEGGGAQILGQRLGGLEQDKGDARPLQQQRGGEADRPCARNHHLPVVPHSTPSLAI